MDTAASDRQVIIYEEPDEPRIRSLFENEKADDLLDYLSVRLEDGPPSPQADQIEYGIEALAIMIRCMRRRQIPIRMPDTLASLLDWANTFQTASTFKNAVLIRTRQLIKEYGMHTADAPPIVHRAKAYIAGRYHEDITLSRLAGEIGVSSSYLSRLFRQQTGVTFTRYLNMRRMEEARKLLSNTNLNIYMISERVGYDSQYYFSRLFKNMTGVTPMEYRNRHWTHDGGGNMPSWPSGGSEITAREDKSGC